MTVGIPAKIKIGTLLVNHALKRGLVLDRHNFLGLHLYLFDRRDIRRRNCNAAAKPTCIQNKILPAYLPAPFQQDFLLLCNDMKALQYRVRRLKLRL